ncbi:hypothetical protein D3C77_603090 [compost metagenome]
MRQQYHINLLWLITCRAQVVFDGPQRRSKTLRGTGINQNQMRTGIHQKRVNRCLNA